MELVQAEYAKITTECYRHDLPDEYVREQAVAFLKNNADKLPQDDLRAFFIAVDLWFAQRVAISQMPLTACC